MSLKKGDTYRRCTPCRTSGTCPLRVDTRRGPILYFGRMMTERERVLTLLAGGRPDRVPWFGDLDYWATSLIGRGLKPAGFKESDAYIDWQRDLRVGFYLQGYFPFKTIIENCRVTEWREGAARLRRVETPRGTLTETWTWLPESFSEAPTEHLVKSAADLAPGILVADKARFFSFTKGRILTLDY